MNSEIDADWSLVLNFFVTLRFESGQALFDVAGMHFFLQIAEILILFLLIRDVVASRFPHINPVLAGYQNEVDFYYDDDQVFNCDKPNVTGSTVEMSLVRQTPIVA